MLIIWSGWGFLVILIVAVIAGLVTAAVHAVLSALGRPDLAFLAFSAGLFAAAAVNWVVGRMLNGAPGRELVDPATGQRLVFRRRHRLFWIDMEYWSVPIALAGLVPLLPLLHLGRG